MMVIFVVIRNHLRRRFKRRCGFKYRSCNLGRRLFKYLRGGLRSWRLFKYLLMMRFRRYLVKYLFLYGRFLCLYLLLLVSFACSCCPGCSLRRFKYLRLHCWRLFKNRLRLRGYCCWRLFKYLLRLLIKYLFLNMCWLFKCLLVLNC